MCFFLVQYLVCQSSVCVVVEQVSDHLEVATATRGNEGRVSGTAVPGVEFLGVFFEQTIKPVHVTIVG